MADNSPRLTIPDWISLVWATWFGSGLLPVMPGTWGTLLAIPFVATMAVLLQPAYYTIAVVVLALLSVPIAARAAFLYRNHPAIMRLNPHARRVFGSDTLQKWIKDPERQREDPGLIVIDEVVGYAVAVLAVPPSVFGFAIAFFLFRLFDIIKIEPGKTVERWGGGIGIVMDDVVAGAYACALTHLSLWLWNLLQLPALP